MSCPNVFQRFINDSFDSESMSSRLAVWQGAINMIQENPVTGVGLDNFNKSLHNQMSADKISKVRRDLVNPTAGQNHAHNQYLDMYAKNGIFGFLALLYFIFINFKAFISMIDSKSYDIRILAVSGLTVVTTYFSYMLSHTILSHQVSTIFMLFILITLLALIKCRKNELERLR